MVTERPTPKALPAFRKALEKNGVGLFPFDYLMIVLEKCSRLVELFSDLYFRRCKLETRLINGVMNPRVKDAHDECGGRPAGGGSYCLVTVK